MALLSNENFVLYAGGGSSEPTIITSKDGSVSVKSQGENNYDLSIKETKDSLNALNEWKEKVVPTDASENNKLVTQNQLPSQGLTTVNHDSTLTGDGTATNPLKVVSGGSSKVWHDSTLLGTGTETDPLKVNQSALGLMGALQTYPILASDTNYTLDAGSGEFYWKAYFTLLTPTIDLDNTDLSMYVFVDAMSAVRNSAYAIFELDEDLTTLHLVAHSNYQVDIPNTVRGFFKVPLIGIEGMGMSSVKTYYATVFTKGYNNLNVAGREIPWLLNSGLYRTCFQNQNIGNWNSNDEMVRVLNTQQMTTDGKTFAFWAQITGYGEL